MPQPLNKYSAHITQPKSQGASQAMLYATGLTEQDMQKPQVGIASVWFEGNPCNMHLLNLAESVKQGVTAAGLASELDLQRATADVARTKQEIASAEFAAQAAGRRPIPEPEIVAGTKASNLAGGDIGGVFSFHVTVPLFDRAKPENAQAEARRVQAMARVEAFEQVLRAQIISLSLWVNRYTSEVMRRKASVRPLMPSGFPGANCSSTT
jgi:hypothetical protein